MTDLMPLAEPKFVEAYRAANSPQAHAIRFALEDAGLRVLIENESLQDGIGEIPSGWTSSPRLLVEESQIAAAHQIIGQIDHGIKSKFGPTVVATYGLLVLLFVGFFAYPLAAIVCASLAALVGLPFVYARIRLGKQKQQCEATRCLACDAILPEAVMTCPKCGWSYEPDDSADSL